MAHRTVRCGTGHYPVRQPRHQAIGFRPLELWRVGPPGCPVVHRTSPVDCPVCHPRVPCSSARSRAFNAVAGDRWRRIAVAPLAHRQSGVHRTCPVNYSGAEIRSWRVQSRSPLGHRTLSGGAPDSPMNYSVAPLKIPEGAKFGLESPVAPDTVRWHTGQSGAPDQGCLRFIPCSFCWTHFLVFLLAKCEPLAPV
jgi:hypothetical protein